MAKKRLIIKDSEYFHDNEDTIKLNFCPNDGEHCKGQMAYMNNRLLLTRKLVENKEYTRAIESLNEAFDSTYDLGEAQCQPCAQLFRESIVKTLEHLVSDLDEMTKGLFRKKTFIADLVLARRIMQELREKLPPSK